MLPVPTQRPLAACLALLLAASTSARADDAPAPIAPASNGAAATITPASNGATATTAPAPPARGSPSPDPTPLAVLRVRVYEQGTITPLVGAEIQDAHGESCITDADGRCDLTVALPDTVSVVASVDFRISEPNHEPLRVTEKLTANHALTVEYRLMPLPSWKRRYESTARGDARTGGERFTLKDEELRNAPGSLGDPFRVIGFLPGVATPIPILPYFGVRGASPGMNGFFLDGIRVPQLFHLLAGGGVVHPRLVDRVDFYPGSYDASFGRSVGGIIDAETRPALDGKIHGEVELKVYDVSAALETTIPTARGAVKMTASGHYGFPGPIIHLGAPSVDISYGDYQFRLDWRGLTVEALGSYDSLVVRPDANAPFGLDKLAGQVSAQSTLAFHRVQIRERYHSGRVDLEAGIVGGIDDSSLLAGQGVRKLSLNGRLIIKVRAGWFTLRTGADLELSRFIAAQFAPDGAKAAPDYLGELSGTRDGVVSAAWAEGTASAWGGRFQAVLGARVDVYHAGKVTLVGIDPRLQLRLRPFSGSSIGDALAISAAIGLYQQPPNFPVPLPGIDTYALALGLQRAIQGSTSIEARLPEAFFMTVTGFYQRFHHANDVVLDFSAALCTVPPPEFLTGLPATVTRQLDGEATGMELLLRRKEGRITGWIAYTLSRSSRVYSCGLRPADFDQTHILNVVVQARLPWKLLAGVHLAYSSGRPYTQIQTPDSPFLPAIVADRNNQRLPDYVELDLRLDRAWTFKKWTLSAFIDVVNATYSQTILSVGYPKDPALGLIRYDKPQFNGGFKWILPSVGLRGSF